MEKYFKIFFVIITTGTIVIDGLNSSKSINKLINKMCNEKNIYNISDIKIPFDVAFRSYGLMCKELSKYELDGSEYLIKVKSKKVSLLDMNKMDEFYQLGYNETKKF